MPIVLSALRGHVSITMKYKAEGKIRKIFDQQQKGSGFQLREFVIEMEGQYKPEFVKFQLTQDKCLLADNLRAGDKVEIDFEFRGRKWNEAYITNLQACEIVKIDSDTGSQTVIDPQEFDPEVDKIFGGVFD